jgi:hypothetical protein
VQAAAAARIVIRLTAFHLKVYVFCNARALLLACLFRGNAEELQGEEGFLGMLPFFLGLIGQLYFWQSLC